MINYIEKGAGLHAYLQSLGLGIVDENGVWTSRNPDHDAINAAIDAYPISDCIEEIKRQIDEHAATLRNKITAGISPAEMASWSIKRAEAFAYQTTNNEADAPTLKIEATTRGIPLADVVARVSGNASTLAGLEATIAGVAGKHKDTLSALSTFEAVLAYDWSGGWPL